MRRGRLPAFPRPSRWAALTALAVAAAALAACGGGSTTATATAPSAGSSPARGAASSAATAPAATTHAASTYATRTASSKATPIPEPTYRGTGHRDIGNLVVHHTSLLEWMCSGMCAPFQINNSLTDANPINIYAASAGSGTIPLPAGTYHHVTVTTAGRWTVKVAPLG